MLGVSGLITTSGDPGGPESGGGGGGSSSDIGTGPLISEEDVARTTEELGGSGGGERNSGGNRWPRQETLALLKIRSDMDAVFRDSSHKAPLWEEVSRKMAELGYRRSSKKCKEKFENVYKYHKRTKDGRATKSDGKSYRFFDQLEAFESNTAANPHQPPRAPPQLTTMAAAPVPGNNNGSSTATSVIIPPPAGHQVTVSSTHISFGGPNPISCSPFPLQAPPQTALTAVAPPTAAVNVFPAHRNNNSNNNNNSSSSPSPLWDSTSSSSTSSDEDIQRRRGRKRKRKDFFEKLMREVIQKQEHMQKKLLETIEKREMERIAREEEWRMQVTARINHDRELLAQERSTAAAKDAAVIKFLQNIAEQHRIQIPTTLFSGEPPQHTVDTPPHTVVPPPHSADPAEAPVAPQPISVAPPAAENNNSLIVDGFVTSMSSSRWPKTEIEALIRIRTGMDTRYQDNGPKGPLWEEVSGEMRKLGYNRNPKRCKEKWENINKYFKKVKESNKKRPEDSKTCPYFNQLEALYKEKAKNEGSFNPLQPENGPIMARPEQQWPPQPSHNINKEEDDEEDDSDDDDIEGGGYEVLPTPGAAPTTGTAE